MRVSSRWALVVTLVTLLALLGPVGVPASRALAASQRGEAAPAATYWPDDEIVLLDSAGRIIVNDPYTQPGMTPISWNSGADTGWQGLAAGDVDGDGADDIVSVRGSEIKVWSMHPSPRVMYDNVASGRQYHLVVTGDFDKSGRKQIIATYTQSGVSGEYVYKFTRGANDASWSQVAVAGGYYGSLWQDMSAGDVNGDGYADLVLVRQSDNLLKTYLGPSWLEVGDFKPAGTWTGVAVGKMKAGLVGQQLALTRKDVGGTAAQSAVFLQLAAPYSDLAIGLAADPNFSKVAVGDVNGDGEAEAVVFRDVAPPTSSIIVVKPNTTGIAPTTWDLPANIWRMIAVGDVNGDGIDEIVAMHSDRLGMYGWNGVGFQAIGTMLTGSFNIDPPLSNMHTMILANLDGTGPVFTVSPASVSITAAWGQQGAANLSLRNTGDSSPISWTITPLTSDPWLTFSGRSSLSGVTPATVPVLANTRLAGLGTHTASFRVTATLSNGQQTSQNVNVSLNVTDPGLVVTPTDLGFFLKPNTSGTKSITLERPNPNSTVAWSAAVMPSSQAAQAIEQLQSGAARVTEQGIVFQGELAAPTATWATLSQDTGTIPPMATINVTAQAGTQLGVSHDVLIVVINAGLPTQVIRSVNLTMAVSNNVTIRYMPMVGR
jgi:hypothetical protein